MDVDMIEKPEVSPRKSAREAVRKVKNSRKNDSRKNQSEPRPSRKRRTVNYEDDPSYSECDSEEEVKEQNKKVPGFRCSPHLVPELIEKLTPKQRGWVKKIDFSSLQNMVDSRSPKSLTMWLVDRVDTKKGTLDVCGISIDIKKGVERILQLPAGGMKVPQPLNGRCKVKRSKSGSSRTGDKYSEHGRGQSAKAATKLLLAENENEDEFCQSFVMLVLCIYLAPTTSLNINRGFYPALMDVTKIRLMDWCGFISEYLLRGIEEYRTSKASHIQVPGCVHILPLLYLDALISLKAIFLPESLALPELLPRIHYIGTDHLDFLASADVKSKTKDHVEYGLLQENLLAKRGGKSQGRKQTTGSNSGKRSRQDVESDVASSEDEYSEQIGAGVLRELIAEVRIERVEILKDLDRKLEDLENKIIDRFNSHAEHLTTRRKHNRKSKKRSDGFNARASEIPASETVAEGTGEETGAGIETTNNKEEMLFERRLGEAGKRSGCDAGLGNSVEHGELVCGGVETTTAALDMSEDGQNGEIEASRCRPDIETIDVESNIGVIEPMVLYGKDGEKMRRADDVVKKGGSSGTEKLYDELNEAVNIGIEAATEASKNREDADNEKTGDDPLNLLLETAEKEGAPLYDNSPIDASPVLRDVMVAPVVSTPGNVMLDGGGKTFNKPIYDKSPFSAACGTAFALGNLNALLSVPEVATESPVTVSRAFQAICSSSSLCEPNGDDNHTGVLGNSPSQSRTVSASSPLANRYHSQSETDGSDPADSMESESNEDYESPDLADANGDSASERGEDPLKSTPDFSLSQGFSFGTHEVVLVPDGPPSPPPMDVRHIPPLVNEIESGFRFRFGGSISSSTEKLFDKYNQKERTDAGMDSLAKIKFVLCKDASESYKTHVTNSSARISSRLSSVFNSDRAKTKIQIKGFHITKGEFVDDLKPNGKVSQDFMGLCSVAIMADWETNKRVILNQATLRELMRVGHECDHMSVAGQLLKFKLEEVEEILLPVLTNHHWILIVIDLGSEKAYFYDSLLPVNHGDNPHMEIWNRLAGNLEQSYTMARNKHVAISFFSCNYPETKMQTNLHDCGYHVIQSLECHKTEDIVGCSKKKTMMPYRKYLSHVLVYHRFNDLNPKREQLQEEAN